MQPSSGTRRRASTDPDRAAFARVVFLGGGLLALGVVVLPNFWENRFSTSCGRPTHRAVTTILGAAENFSLEHDGRWPDSLRDLVDRDPEGRSYLRQTEVPRDPWGHPYRYDPPGPGEDAPRVFTLGADGIPGGEGQDRDVYAHAVLAGTQQG